MCSVFLRESDIRSVLRYVKIRVMDNADQPGQPQTPSQPESHTQQSTPDQLAAIHTSNVRKTRWGLILLIGPTAFIIIATLFYASANFIFNRISSSSNFLIVGALPMGLVLDKIHSVTSAFATLTWFPGIIVGIVLLVTRKPER